MIEPSQSTSNDPGPSLDPKNSVVPTTSSMLPIQSKSSAHSENRQILLSNCCAGSSHQGQSSQSVIANQSTNAYDHESDDDASCHEVKVANEVIYVSSDSDDDEGNFKSNPSRNDIIRYCSICKDNKKFDHDCSLYNKEFSTCLVPNCNILSRSVRDFDPHYRQHIGFTAREWICRCCYKENKKNERDANGRHICRPAVNAFKCYTCGLVLNNMAEFANHKLKKHNGRLINSSGNFLCLYCEKSSPDMMKIDEHIKQYHYKKKGNVQENTVEYGIKHKEPKVPETTVLMNDKNVAKKNISFGQENMNKFEYSYKHVFFTCLKPSCNLIFQYFPNFKFHHRQHFKTGNKVMCWQCCSPFNTVADLRLHQVKGNCRTPGMFNCFQCPEAFDDIERLSIHKYIVHNGQLIIQKKGQKTIVCPSCKSHVIVDSFKSHLIQCYSNKTNSSTKSKPVPQLINKKSKKFNSNKCGICGKICLTRAALSSHIKVHNPNRATKMIKKRFNEEACIEVNSGNSSLSQDGCETDFTNLNSDNMCSVVEVSSTTNTNYNNDVQRFVKYDEFPFVNGVYSCIQCPRKFNTKMGLAKHWPFCKPKKIVYTNRANKILPNNYYCTDCKEYFTRVGFGSHYKNIHGKKLALKRCKRFSCTKCSSKFLYKVALAMHYQHMHDELKTSVNHAPSDTSKPVDPVKLPVVSETTSLATDYTGESMEQNEENCNETIKEEINNTMSQSADQWEEDGGLENCNNILEDTLVNSGISEEMINVDGIYEDISILPSEILSIELNDNVMVVERPDHESTMEVENTNVLKENNVTEELEKNNEFVENDEANGTEKNCTNEVITANNEEDNLIIVKKEFIQNNVDERMEVSGVQNANEIVNKPDKVNQEHKLLVSKEEIHGTNGLNGNLVM